MENKYTDEPNLENQVEVRQALIEEQKEMISILSRDLARICHDSYELLLLASIPASHSKEVYEHLESCAAVIEKLTEKEEEEEEGKQPTLNKDGTWRV